MRHPDRMRQRPAAEAMEARLVLTGHLTSPALDVLSAATLQGPGHVVPANSPTSPAPGLSGQVESAAVTQGTSVTFINSTGRTLKITVQSFPIGTPGTRDVLPGYGLPVYTTYSNPIPYYQLKISGQTLKYYGPFGGSAYIVGNPGAYSISTTPPIGGGLGGGGAGAATDVQVETATLVNLTGHAVRLRLAGTLLQGHPTRFRTLRAGQAVDALAVSGGQEIPTLTATFRGQAPVTLPAPLGSTFPAPVDAIRQSADGSYSITAEPAGSSGLAGGGGQAASKFLQHVSKQVLNAFVNEGKQVFRLFALPFRAR